MQSEGPLPPDADPLGSTDPPGPSVPAPGRRAGPAPRLRRIFLAVWALVLLGAVAITVVALGLVLAGEGSAAGRPPGLLAAALTVVFIAAAGLALNLGRGRAAMVLTALAAASLIASLLLR